MTGGKGGERGTTTFRPTPGLNRRVGRGGVTFTPATRAAQMRAAAAAARRR